MDRGLYSSTSGGMLAAKRLDVIANNIANVNTVGFKAERIVTRQQQFSDTLAGSIGGLEGTQGDFDRTPGVVTLGTATDFSPGPVQYTGQPLNVALKNPKDFFVVVTPQGELYTRAGNFMQTNEGLLVTPDGMPVSGDGGPINLPPGVAKLSATGAIIVNGQTVGKLKTVRFNDVTKLERTEGVRFRAPIAAGPTDIEPDLVPESVEMPNVGVVEGMVDMMSSQRAFEAYSKTVKSIDELNDRAIRSARATG